MVEPLSLGFFIILTILLALAFDFVNGFHDSANAIATVVATKVLKPFQAVLMAGVFNFIGPFVFTLAVANAIGKGIIDTKDSSVAAAFVVVVFAALVGATVWDLITWYYGLPTSSSHAIVGGLVGAALAAGGPAAVLLPTWAEVLGIGKWTVIGAALGVAGGVGLWVWSRIRLPRALFGPLMISGAVAGLVLGASLNGLFEVRGKDVAEVVLMTFVFGIMGTAVGALAWITTQAHLPAKALPGFTLVGALVALVTVTLNKALPMGGLTKTLLFMIVSPMLGFLAGYLLSIIVMWLGRSTRPAKVDRWSRKLQIASSAFYALTHGTNDAQKTMGVIGVLLFGAGAIGLTSSGNLAIPVWVIIASAAAMGLGTMFGGWRIVHTMANRITHLRPAQGVAAETGGGVVLVAMASAGIPVSTTHAISSSIMGVGASKRASAVRWGVGRRIVGAWLITIPASALVAFLTFLAVDGAVAEFLDTPAGFAVAVVVTLAVTGFLLWIGHRGAHGTTPRVSGEGTGHGSEPG